MSHTHVSSSTQVSLQSRKYRKNAFWIGLLCTYPPLRNLSPLSEVIYGGHSFLPKALPNQCEGPLSSNPSLWECFLILETASPTYHWPLFPILQQQQSQVSGHRSTLQSSHPLTELSVYRDHKLTALVWIPFLDKALLDTFHFLHFFHFPFVTWSSTFSSEIGSIQPYFQGVYNFWPMQSQHHPAKPYLLLGRLTKYDQS